MAVAASGFFDRAAAQMDALSRAADTLNTQIATGKRIAAPSDAPLSYSRLRGLAQAGADADAYGGNLKLAASTLSAADTAMTAMTAQLTQARQLTVQASTGTLTADNRRAIGEQLAGIVDMLKGLAGGNDPQGKPLFGDTTGAAAVTTNADGTVALASGTAPSVPIADGQSVATGVTAGKLFDLGNGTNTLAMLSTLATTLQNGGTVPDDTLTTLATAASLVTNAQASVGARAARVELEQSSQASAATTRETVRSGLEDTDVTTAITQLQKTMTTLQATQASFTKLSSLSLFDYLK